MKSIEFTPFEIRDCPAAIPESFRSVAIGVHSNVYADYCLPSKYCIYGRSNLYDLVKDFCNVYRINEGELNTHSIEELIVEAIDLTPRGTLRNNYLIEISIGS